MSTYDMLPRGSQIKLWDCDFRTYRVGDIVPSFYPDYIVLLVEGGYIRIRDGEIIKIVENKKRKAYYPEDFPSIVCFDKWGNEVNHKDDLSHANIIGGNYYWWQGE